MRDPRRMIPSDSDRRIHLRGVVEPDEHNPPFLVTLLRQHLQGHRHEYVFVTADGALLRRSESLGIILRGSRQRKSPLPPRPKSGVARSSG